MAGLPTDRNKVRARLIASGIEPRTARGNGGPRFEWLITDLPQEVQDALAAGLPVAPTAGRDDAMWAQFHPLPGKLKRRAERQHGLACAVRRLVEADVARSQAVAQVAREAGRSERNLWKILAKLEGVAPENWLPVLALAERRRGAAPAAERPWRAPLLKLWRSPNKRDLVDVVRQRARTARATIRRGASCAA